MVVVRKIKIVLSLFMLAVLLWPSVLKLDHHHDFYTVPAAGNQLAETHEKCSVCSFEFSIFLQDDAVIASGHVEEVRREFPLYDKRNNISVSEYTYLLRAPPANLS